MSDLSGRVAIVTGASSGIGRATAVELARRGASVVIDYPDADSRDDAEETAERVRTAARERQARHPEPVSAGSTSNGPASNVPDSPPDSCLIIEADISDANAVAHLFAETIKRYGRVDILVNNAGIQIKSPTHETEVESFDKVLAVNLRGAFLCARAALRHFLDRGDTKGEAPGVIVNMSSVHEKIPRPQFLSYAVSKFGLHGLTQTLALEYADRGIRVNAVAPGATITPIQSWLDDEKQHEIVESHIPMGRTAQPEEMARLVAFLASDEAAYITGQTLFADGGLTLYPDFQEPWSG